MVQTPAEYLDGVAQLFAAEFEDAVVVTRDDRPARHLLEMAGRLDSYRRRRANMPITFSKVSESSSVSTTPPIRRRSG